MREIIDRKVYDTDRAILLGTAKDGDETTSLYRTSSVAHFIAKSGRRGDSIVPMDSDAAREWAGRNLSPAEFHRYFDYYDPPESNEPRASISITMRLDSLELLRTASEYMAIPMSHLVEFLILRNLGASSEGFE